MKKAMIFAAAAVTALTLIACGGSDKPAADPSTTAGAAPADTSAAGAAPSTPSTPSTPSAPSTPSTPAAPSK